jgi:putative acetyltransferase
MNLAEFTPAQSQEVIGLFRDVFSRAEGKEEGLLIGDLVADLIASTNEEDLLGFVASKDERLVGAIFLSRFFLSNEKVAFILSPVAVATMCQGQGIGQSLINYGIESLQSLGVELVFTYGDPNYYSKVGFEPISENVVKAPFELSQPEGWLAQSLTACSIEAIDGRSRSVKALAKAEYW